MTVSAGTHPLYEATGLNSKPTINFSNANNAQMVKSSFALGTGNTLTVFFVGSYNASVNVEPDKPAEG